EPDIAKSIEKAELAGRENLMEAIRKDKNVNEAKKAYQKKFFALQIAAGMDSSHAVKVAKHQADALVRAYSTPKMQSQLLYDPPSDLKKLDIPVLATFGGKDTQVLISKNLPPIRRALDSAKVSYQIN